MSDTNTPEQETPETQDVTPEESGAAVVPETEEAANDAEATAAETSDVESADVAETSDVESADVADADVADGEQDEAAVDGAAGDEVDPAEEFKAELRMQEGDWYVIHSYAGYENRVKIGRAHV